MKFSSQVSREMRNDIRLGSSALPTLPVKSALLIEFDLFAPHSVGGGQTSYRKLILRNPHVQFFYLARTNSNNGPPNSTPIPVHHVYNGNWDDLPGDMTHFYDDYLLCWQIAASVRLFLGACEIDIVDTPDYRTAGLFLLGALRSHGIKVRSLALALHGTLSSAIRDEWATPVDRDRVLAQLRLRESLQYALADARYAFSERYAGELAAQSGGAATILDPTGTVGDFVPIATVPPGRPRIVFVGRRERRKGPDLFIDLAWCLRAHSFEEIVVIGGESIGISGVGSHATLHSIAANRRINVRFQDHADHAELAELFKGRSIIVLPSRYDQFNLIALEALRFGCPVLISESAGATQWIRERFPELGDLSIRIDCSRSASVRLQELVDRYDEERARLVSCLLKHLPQSTAVDVPGIYAPVASGSMRSRSAAGSIQHRFDSFNRPKMVTNVYWRLALEDPPDLPSGLALSMLKGRQVVSDALSVLPNRAGRFVLNAKRRILDDRNLLNKAATQTEKFIRRVVSDGLYDDMVDRSSVWLRSREATRILALRHKLLHSPERSSEQISAKLRSLSGDLQTAMVGRLHVFRDLMRLEMKRPGKELTAAVYGLRLMRWAGRDLFGDLPFVSNTLRNSGFEFEAEVAEAMFGDALDSYKRSRSLLDRQFERNRTKVEDNPQIIDDRRDPEKNFRVCVIVSLYNAASKLGTLLDNLASQSLALKGRLEVVLIDSGSPTNEQEIFEEFSSRNRLPIAYVRSRQRETIQAAWNRGIKMARAPYLAFLGVDEGLHPEALEVLSDRLDVAPSVDWVMADSIVTDVDRKGIFARDVMTYDRRGFTPHLVYLETCYLSWVGGLYRKSIHDRFGYYDESFRAAGDTEFKGRILRYIKTEHVPRLLGVFNNYPEERTTQHPRAEIEDLRAWYLHRTPAGIAYSFDSKPIEDVERLFVSCLGYRKSFCGHVSTDFDMAAAIVNYLSFRGENPVFAENARTVVARWKKHTNQVEAIDLRQSPSGLRRTLRTALFALRDGEEEDQVTFGLPTRPTYRLFNDNRFEQHWWSWSS